ncbi:hypothetical protein DL766_002260 [Monosporascus sp. MC13-8B]|uniref:Uncharacterized protein n=1 Tax=Monosporascus cannonballus TaxID=155416 RepID=A0ABY0HKH4_9PEZI|nr:hypothetical protein DL763_004116 [Monosporascus cannonballus]RYO94585.1 hypothetical protein DL762_000477 [Monosporascus cannonballus]RYP35990.1 hypothetical protein DL766_002260 [Monosporascus sp. MC13-8B]
MPLELPLEEGALGIDLGSTSLRGRIVCPRTSKVIPIQNSQTGPRSNRLTVGDFSVAAYPFGRTGKVYLGDDPDPERESVSLKYAFYVLANGSDELLEQYRLLDKFCSRKDDPVLRKRLQEGLDQLFSRFFGRVKNVCKTRRVLITKIALSIPSQWTLEFEDVYRDVISRAARVVNTSEIEIFFVTETQALAHFICGKYLEILIQHPNGAGSEVFLFLDFGGHNMNSCIYHVGYDTANEPRFYLIGAPVGAGGGSELWEYNVLQKAIEFIETQQGRPRAMSNKHKQRLRDDFDRDKARQALGESQSFQFDATGLDGKPLDISLGPEIVTSCFNEALKRPLEKVEEQLQQLAAMGVKEPRVIVTGGTARHTGLRARLAQLCEEKYRTHPPVWEEDLEADEYTVKVAEGAAYAVSNPVTVEKFFDRGAAFGIQKLRRWTRDSSSSEENWDDIAEFLMSKDRQGTRIKISVNGLDKLKIICDPFFSPDGDDDNLHYSNCYDILPLGQPTQGDWYYSMTLDGDGDNMCMVLERSLRPHKKYRASFFDETRIPLFYEKGSNCVQVGYEHADPSALLASVVERYRSSTTAKRKAPRSDMEDTSTDASIQDRQNDSMEFQYIRPMCSFAVPPYMMDGPHPLSAASLFSLTGSVAVVTGGGTGVGLMIAQTLAANGAKVYITGRRKDVIETSARVHGSPDKLGPQGGSIIPIVMDVTSKDSIKAVVAEISEGEGHLDLLVNNAGFWAGRALAKPEEGPEAFGNAMFAESIEDAWQKAFLTNSTSPYFVTAAFLPLLAKAAQGPTGRVGSVINNTSASGFLRLTLNGQFSYNVSKAAANHLTRQMALDLSHENIRVRVNGIALGYFPSEMTTAGSDQNNESTYSLDEFRQFTSSMGARVQRMGGPRDIASAILLLATNEYMWGEIIIVDGGFALSVPGNM